MYIGTVRSFTLRSSWSHDANTGHLVKSRALTNHIIGNRLTEQAGNGSYELDLPNGGRSYVIGNLIQQGPSSPNSTMLQYAAEGAINANSHLFVINNTFVNDKGSGTAVGVHSSVTTPVVARNNITTGSPTFVAQASAVLTTNCNVANPMFVNRAAFDYHLQAASPCVDAGSAPGTGDGESLTPTEQYVHPTGQEARPVNGVIDAGAYER